MTTRTADGVEVLRDRRRVFSPDTRHAVPSQVDAKFRQQRILDHTNHVPLDSLLPSRPSYVPKIPESVKSRAMREKTRAGTDIPMHVTPLRRCSLQAQQKNRDVASDAEEMTALLLRLDLDNVSALHALEGGSQRMSQDEFLATVVANIHGTSTVSMEATVTQLCHLFHKIDHDEDGVITWTEFTSFVLESMRGYSEQLLVDGLHEYNKTAISTPIVVNRGMEALIQANDSQCFIGFEQQSKVFQVYDASRHGQLVGTSAPCTGGHLVDITTVPPWDYIVASTTSTTINFWDGRELLLRQQLPTTEVQTVLRWNDQHKLLYSASTTGLIRAWNCDTLECMGTVNLKTKHSVTDMTFLSPRANAVVASLAPTISIMDISSNKQLHQLVGHRLGVTCVKYSLAYRYIISAGLDHDVRLWNPYVESSIATLKGHHHQVVGLTWVDGSPEVHSVDDAGFVKIWDLRTYRCIQTLSTVDKHLSSASSNHKSTSAMVYLPDLNRIVLASSRVDFHDAVLWNASDENALEKETPSMALFMPSTLTILTTAGRHVRVWNAQTGQLTYNLRALVPSTISAGCYGPGSIGYLGTQTGRVYCLNVVSGTLVRNRAVHSREVSSLVLVEFRDRSVAQRVVSASLDGTCVVSDAETLAPLNTMNHWHGVNGHPATRVVPLDVHPPHDYFVPHPTKAMYSDYALDCLKRIFAVYDPDKTGETAFSHAAPLFDAVVKLNHRPCQRNESYLAKLLLASSKSPATTLTFVDFLLMVHDTWHGLGYAAADIGCVAVSHQYNVIVTASMDGHFCVWHGSKCEPLASSSRPIGEHTGITAIVFLEPHPIFAVANDHGGLELYAIPPHPLRYDCLFRTASPATIHNIAWCLPRTLVTGDEEGNVACWRIDGLFEKVSEDDNHTNISDSRRTAQELMQTKQTLVAKSRRRRRRSTHQYEYTLEGQVSLDASWSAHIDALCTLYPCNAANQTASHVVTCGWDGFVRVWALSEERLNPHLDDNVAWGLTFRHAVANGKIDVHAEATRFLAACDGRPTTASPSSPSNSSTLAKCDPAEGKKLRAVRRKVFSAGTVRRLPSDKRTLDNTTLFEDGEFVISPVGTRCAMRLQEALDSLEPTVERGQREKRMDPRIQRIQHALKVLQPAQSQRRLRVPTDDASIADLVRGVSTTDQHSAL
ncbi:hypothetical protein, variant [Aphanomyces invadans]|uniref:EF-hand domain-containing protein n=1 Tax=Aphanomyces invadans TaxID=157072 RepID=A0A024T8L9_9STRA|nr:hypothetical protein, variant [Aphanomyces invadans]ETV90334.1 hypothetical protein, variant [Aphanomyces invadans]|eukprot:XP_008881061.1 hypothetical protein, variant [Aphanomyces invadans]